MFAAQHRFILLISWLTIQLHATNTVCTSNPAQMAAFMELSKERKEEQPQDDRQLQMYIDKMCELVEVANESVRDPLYDLKR